MRRLLILLALLMSWLNGAETLTVTFTTTSAGGSYSPRNIVAAWVETSSGTFVKTIGDWSNRRRSSLTQWRAKAGTADTDAVMGSTNSSHASRTVSWDMTAKATGTAVADGVYKIWFETVDGNTPPAGTTTVRSANRFSFSFTKDGVPQGATSVTDATGKYTSISYTYTGRAPTITAVSPASGGTAGGTAVTITGTDLGGVTAVTFGGTAATTVVVGSATSITCTSPAHAAGAVSVSATSPNGTGTKASAFTYTSSATYTVTYQGNGSTGGTVPTDTATYASGQTVTVKANTGSLVKSGFAFAGWNAAADGSGTSYAATGSATFSMLSANVILYARWVPTFTVTYDGNGQTGGAVPTDTAAYTTGQTVTVKANSGTLVKTGAVFGGWNTAANGLGTTYAAGSGTLSMGSANLVLYAKWVPVGTYSVTYDGNGSTGGTPPVDATAYTAGQTVTVKANTGSLIKTRATFAGWNTLANGAGTSYGATGSVTFPMPSASLTLYAQWTPLPTYTVTYRGNGNTGGSVPSDATAYFTGQVVTVMGNTGTLVKAGATLVGWNRASDGSGTSYAATGSDSFTMGAANVVLYAHWQDPQVTDVTPSTGSTEGGTLVTLTGTGLGVTTGVAFGGVPATGLVATATTVTCYTPAGSAGNVPVNLITAGGSLSVGSFTYQLPGPSLTGLSPSEGTTAGGTIVQLSGSYLSGVTDVSFGGTAATEVMALSDSQVTCRAPAHGAGVVDVVLTAPTGSAALTASYTYSAPLGTAYIDFQPSAAGGIYAPTHVLAVWVETDTGTFVRTVGDWSGERRDHLSQWGLQSGVDADAVMGATRTGMTAVRNLIWDLRDRDGHPVPDGTYALWVELVDADEPPAGTTSVVGARRTHLAFTIAGRAVTLAGPVDQDGFTAVRIGPSASTIPAPTLTSVSPAQGTLAGGTTITLTGAFLSGATAVTVGGTPATSVNVLSDTQVICLTPAGAVGSATVSVTTAGGTASQEGAFTYVSGGGTAYVSFTPSSAGGGYAPKQVLVVWVETTSGTFVRTIGNWSDTRRSNLSQWMARSGGDSDAVMGATRVDIAPVNNLSWDLRDRSGNVVADGSYRLWIEVADDNNPAASPTTTLGARRTYLDFTVSSHAVAPVGPVDQDGFSSLRIGSDTVAALTAPVDANVAAEQRTARCGSGSVYALLLGALTLLFVGRRRA